MVKLRRDTPERMGWDLTPVLVGWGSLAPVWRETVGVSGDRNCTLPTAQEPVGNSKGIGAAAIPMTVSGNNSCDPAVISVGHAGLTPVPEITLPGKKGTCGFARMPFLRRGQMSTPASLTSLFQRSAVRFRSSYRRRTRENHLAGVLIQDHQIILNVLAEVEHPI